MMTLNYELVSDNLDKKTREYVNLQSQYNTLLSTYKIISDKYEAFNVTYLAMEHTVNDLTSENETYKRELTKTSKERDDCVRNYGLCVVDDESCKANLKMSNKNLSDCNAKYAKTYVDYTNCDAISTAQAVKIVDQQATIDDLMRRLKACEDARDGSSVNMAELESLRTNFTKVSGDLNTSMLAASTCQQQVAQNLSQSIAGNASQICATTGNSCV